MNRQARRITVHGMVQGVGFRAFVQLAGRRRGLTGDVRNMPDGTVDIVAEGNAGALEAFIAEVRKGPRMAVVDRVEVHEVPATGGYTDFKMEGW